VAALEQAPHVVGDGVVAALAAEAALVGLARAARPHDEAPAHPLGVRVLDHRGDRDGAARLDVLGDRTELGEALGAHGLDEDVEDAAAGQPDGDGVVVADAVALEHRSPAGHHRLRQLVDGRLDTAAGD